MLTSGCPKILSNETPTRAAHEVEGTLHRVRRRAADARLGTVAHYYTVMPMPINLT